MATQGWSGIVPEPTKPEDPIPDNGRASPDVWERVWLGGDYLPGVARVSGRVGRKLDIKKGPNDGATFTDLGYEPARVEIRLKLWSQRQLDEWATYVRLLHPRRQGREKGPVPLDIKFPPINMHGIKSVYVETIGFLEPSDPGVWETSLSLIEFFPMKAATAKTHKSSKDDITKRNTSFEQSNQELLPWQQVTLVEEPWSIIEDPSRNGTALEP